MRRSGAASTEGVTRPRRCTPSLPPGRRDASLPDRLMSLTIESPYSNVRGTSTPEKRGVER